MGLIIAICGCMYMYNICISLSDISQDEGCKNDHKRADRIIQSFAYKKGTICYSEDGDFFLRWKRNEKWNKHIPLRIHRHLIVGTIL